MTQPVSFEWFVDQPTSAPPLVDPGQAFAVGGALGCEPCFVSQADFLLLMDRLLPPGYLDPLKTVGPGYELYQGLGRMFERASIAVGHLECGQFLLSATGGARARARVAFYRTSPAAGALVCKAGTKVSCSRGGQVFTLLADAAFGPTDLATGDAVVEAEAMGYEYNVRGRRVTARGDVVAGEIDTIDLPLQDPAFGDPSVRVQQFQDGAGGVPASLDALGNDRGIVRTVNEPDGAYVRRVRALADTVTPAALRRALVAAFSSLGAPARYVEGWDQRLQTCWDAPDSAPTASGYDPTTFIWDDPRKFRPDRDVWLSEDYDNGSVIVVLPRLPSIADSSGVWGDTAVSADGGDFSSPLGRRAVSAWDLDDPDVQGWVWDGYDAGQRAVYLGLWNSIESMAPAGMALAFDQDDP